MQLNTPEPFDSQVLGTESVFIRNYDTKTSHLFTVRVTDSCGEVAVERVVTIDSSETLNLRPHLERGSYRVEVSMESGASDSVECSIGNGSNECAVVECGNGIVSATAEHRIRRN